MISANSMGTMVVKAKPRKSSLTPILKTCHNCKSETQNHSKRMP